MDHANDNTPASIVRLRGPNTGAGARAARLVRYLVRAETFAVAGVPRLTNCSYIEISITNPAQNPKLSRMANASDRRQSTIG
jgi:hypothetical protein